MYGKFASRRRSSPKEEQPAEPSAWLILLPRHKERQSLAFITALERVLLKVDVMRNGADNKGKKTEKQLARKSEIALA